MIEGILWEKINELLNMNFYDRKIIDDDDDDKSKLNINKDFLKFLINK